MPGDRGRRPVRRGLLLPQDRLQPLLSRGPVLLRLRHLRQHRRRLPRPAPGPVQARPRPHLLHAADGGDRADLGADVLPDRHPRLPLLLRHPGKPLRRPVLRLHPAVDGAPGPGGHQGILRGPAQGDADSLGGMGRADGLVARAGRGHGVHAHLPQRHPAPPVVDPRAPRLPDDAAAAGNARRRRGCRVENRAPVPQPGHVGGVFPALRLPDHEGAQLPLPLSARPRPRLRPLGAPGQRVPADKGRVRLHRLLLPRQSRPDLQRLVLLPLLQGPGGDLQRLRRRQHRAPQRLRVAAHRRPRAPADRGGDRLHPLRPVERTRPPAGT